MASHECRASPHLYLFPFDLLTSHTHTFSGHQILNTKLSHPVFPIVLLSLQSVLLLFVFYAPFSQYLFQSTSAFMFIHTSQINILFETNRDHITFYDEDHFQNYLFCSNSIFCFMKNSDTHFIKIFKYRF